MIIGVRIIELFIPGSQSLKEKRFVVRSLKDKIRARFNVSIAEIDYQDLWQRSLIAIAAVSTSTQYINGQLDLALEIVNDERRAVITNVETQIL